MKRAPRLPLLTPVKRQAGRSRSLSLGTLALLAQVLLSLSTDAATRQPWTQSRLQGSPEPAKPLRAERVFPNVALKEPVDLASTPSLPYLFALELGGKLFSISLTDQSAPARQVADFSKQGDPFGAAYGIAFHPGFATNRFLYLTYTISSDLTNGTRVSRFQLSRLDPPEVNLQSEKIIITWPAGGHNGGCLKFGPDGMLYISTGDSGTQSPPDPLNTGQDVSDLLSSILRIDVDHEDGQKAYRIPKDNPFIHRKNARPEVWAYGLRNPWKMSFEPNSGALWVGDVGWELWELIFRIDHPGMNCGWSVVEGRQPVKPESLRGPTPIEKPIRDHSHEEAASITGGLIYRGKRLAEWRDHYIYGDWETGRMWALRHRQGIPEATTDIASTGLKIVAFGEDPAGELYFLDYSGGGLYQLARESISQSSQPFPRKLSQTGLFTTLNPEIAAPGVYEFRVSAPLKTDAGEARRWIGIPGEKPIQFHEDYWTTPRAIVPTNTVLARTVLTASSTNANTVPRRVETQLLHYNGSAWNAYTYRWNAEETDADLVDAQGGEWVVGTAKEGQRSGEAETRWRYSSRTECLRCHNPWNATLLGFNPVQLWRGNAQANSPVAGSLPWLEELGLLQAKSSAHTVDPTDSTEPLELRARSFLHANCGHCHRDAAGGAVLLRLNLQPPLDQARLLDAKPMQGNFGLKDARLLEPGDPLRSILLYRFAKSGHGHMPYIGAPNADPEALQLLSRWIEAMPPGSNRSDSQHLLQQARELVSKERSDPRSVQQSLAPLIATPERALALRIALGRNPLSEESKRTIAARARETQVTALTRDLLLPLVTETPNQDALGASPDIGMLLRQPGKSDRGQSLFFSPSGPQCHTCHKVGAAGREVGPDLTHIGSKYGPRDLLQQILTPSAKIDPPFVTWTAILRSGDGVTGCIRRESPSEVVIRDTTGTDQTLQRSDLESLTRSPFSLMPEGLFSALTLQEAADLLAFLSGLK